MMHNVFTFKVGEVYSLEDIPETHRELFRSCYHQGQCDDDIQTAIPPLFDPKPTLSYGQMDDPKQRTTWRIVWNVNTKHVLIDLLVVWALGGTVMSIFLKRLADSNSQIVRYAMLWKHRVNSLSLK